MYPTLRYIGSIYTPERHNLGIYTPERHIPGVIHHPEVHREAYTTLRYTLPYMPP